LKRIALKFIPPWLKSLALLLCACMFAAKLAAQPPEDPYLWLEEIAGENAFAWVRSRNAEAE